MLWSVKISNSCFQREAAESISLCRKTGIRVYANYLFAGTHLHTDDTRCALSGGADDGDDDNDDNDEIPVCNVHQCHPPLLILRWKRAGTTFERTVDAVE